MTQEQKIIFLGILASVSLSIESFQATNSMFTPHSGFSYFNEITNVSFQSALYETQCGRRFTSCIASD